ncbi:MAG: GIY-YIG nuclease family protein [Candidatus Marinimicrobia bacterium]|nr:GIY-YIG nuclease family protein [Candidatus Neomarinimicrobiota bacterium]MCF7840745.1 GIY-YIG nuclease family protein [Candidatus Neomarinimicrobiota bacterium]MCF7902361.1 GIY-YIG nuclease family protein [Candidatus Neomarinimicrobiota bacterium]
MRTGYVYILKCADDTFYTGVPNNLERRLFEHKTSGGSGYTKRRQPVELVWNSDEMPIDEAILLEKKIKGWQQAKKVALIKGEYKKLGDLWSRRKK